MWKKLIADLNTVMSYELIAKELGMSKSSIWDLQHKEGREPMFSTYMEIRALHKKKSRAIRAASEGPIKRARGKV